MNDMQVNLNMYTCTYMHYQQVYNLVGVVRCHSDGNTSMVEVDFHNTGTHHSFSLSNFVGHKMAALNEQALVLACERDEDQPR